MQQDRQQAYQNMLIQSGLVNDICKPLFEMSGITAFAYHEINSDGDFVRLASDPVLFTKLLETGHLDSSPIAILDNHQKPGNYVLDVPSDTNYPFSIKRIMRSLNRGHFLILIRETQRHGKDYIQFFSFATDLGNNNVNHFYVNHLDLLEKFGDYFMQRMSSFLDRAKRVSLAEQKRTEFKFKLAKFIDAKNGIVREKETVNKYITPEKVNHKVKQLLTRREVDVVNNLIDGKSAQETAENLFISRRTVEKHIENIYAKMSCNSRSELMKAIFAS